MDETCLTRKLLQHATPSRLPYSSAPAKLAHRAEAIIERTESPSAIHPAAATDIVVTSMADLLAWDDSGDELELGSGMAGTVLLQRHAQTKTPVALKVVDLPTDFEDEIRIHRAISGLPWFPAFYGTFKLEDTQAALAMEFLGDAADGKSITVSHCLDNAGPVLTRDEWFDIFHDVAEGLKALHGKGYLWNDLKEDNVVLVKDEGTWRAKLIDFGWSSDIASPLVVPTSDQMAQAYRDEEQHFHLAPECVLNGKPCSTASDVYALGRLLAIVGQEFDYEDFEDYGRFIMIVDNPKRRPTLQEFTDRLFYMHLTEGREDGSGTSTEDQCVEIAPTDSVLSNT